MQVAPVGSRHTLHTYVTLDDIEALSGQVPQGRLTLRLMGGFDGRQGLHIPGTPKFRQGERVLLFVQDNGREHVPLVGWGQGLFRLQVDGDGRTVVHDADDNEVVGIRQGHVMKRAGQARKTPLVGGPSAAIQGGMTNPDCYGSPVRHTWNDASMYISTTSFPIGSVWDTALQNARHSWEAVGGSSFTFYIGRDTDGSHDSGNHVTEVYFTGSMVKPNALAETFVKYVCGYNNWGQLENYIDETDIAFNVNYSWNTGAFNYANFGSPYHFETVALHELGHVLGFNHEDTTLATMNSFYPNGGPLGYYKKVAPLGDDHVAMRALYGNGGGESDMAGLMAKRTGPGSSWPVYSPDSAARGSTVTIEVSYANLGTAFATFPIRYYLSSNDYITAYDRSLGESTAWAYPGRSYTYSVTLSIPADVAPGTYWLGYLLDPDNAVPERDDWNNNRQPWPRSITIY